MDQRVSVWRPRGTVFVIEDDADMRDSLEALFQARGMPVACYESGAAFRARHDRDIEGCLIVDVNRPEGGPVEVMRTLRAAGYRLPLIVLTGSIGSVLRAKALEAGAQACLDKPFEPSQLIAMVRRALATSGAGAT